MRRVRQLAAGLLYVIDTYGYVAIGLVLLLVVLAGAIDNPVINPQNFGAK